MSEYEFLVPELECKLLRHQRQEQGEAAEDHRNQNQSRNHQRDTSNSNGSTHSHVQQQQHCSISFHQNHHHPSLPIPPSVKNVHQIEELTWENGQLHMHGRGGSTLLTDPPKLIWGSCSDTLDSIVHQASTSSLRHTQYHADDIVPKKSTVDSTGISEGSSLGDLRSSSIVPSNSSWNKSQNTVHELKKRVRLESVPFGIPANKLLRTSCSYRTDQDERKTRNTVRSMCGSASAPFCREDHDPTMMTWASFDSPRSFKTNRSANEDSAASPSESDEDQETKTETTRSQSIKRSRAAAIHNQSERMRRDRINQKMKTLQRLVPNACKTDKASMLDEVIEYLKQLQAQVQMMDTMRNISSSPQMTMMPIGMIPQQQLQMSLLSRMSSAGFVGYGLGLGMGVVDINSMARVMAQPQALPPLLHPAASAAMAFASTPQLMVPPAHTLSSAQASSDAGNSASFQLPDPHRALLTQRMNMELYNKMAAALLRQQTTSQVPSTTEEAKRE